MKEAEKIPKAIAVTPQLAYSKLSAHTKQLQKESRYTPKGSEKAM